MYLKSGLCKTLTPAGINKILYQNTGHSKFILDIFKPSRDTSSSVTAGFAAQGHKSTQDFQKGAI